MFDIHNLSRVRLINLLIPTSTDPLITPYTKQLSSKILPLKKQYSILSNLKLSQKKTQKNIQLTRSDYQKINRSYRSLKRYKKTNPEASHIESIQKQKQITQNQDPRYRRLIQLRKQMIKKKNQSNQKKQYNQIKRSQTFTKLTSNQKSYNFLVLTEPTFQQSKQSKISNFTFFKQKNEHKDKKQTNTDRYHNYLQNYISERNQSQNNNRIKIS